MPSKIKLPVIRNSWDRQDYAVLLHAPVTDARRGATSTYMRVVGINKKHQYKQFDVPLRKWQLAAAAPIRLLSSAAESVDTARPHTGSKLTNPWRIAFVVLDSLVVVYAGALGNPPTHYHVRGVRNDGKEIQKVVDAGTFVRAQLHPTVFVEVESLRVGTGLVADPLPA